MHEDVAGGRPSKISKTAMAEIKTVVLNGERSGDGRHANISKLLVDGAKKTARENCKSEIEVSRLEVEGFSETSLRRYTKILDTDILESVSRI